VAAYRCKTKRTFPRLRILAPGVPSCATGWHDQGLRLGSSLRQRILPASVRQSGDRVFAPGQKPPHRVASLLHFGSPRSGQKGSGDRATDVHVGSTIGPSRQLGRSTGPRLLCGDSIRRHHEDAQLRRRPLLVKPLQLPARLRGVMPGKARGTGNSRRLLSQGTAHV
jgi:hypothetical protein